MKSRIHPTLLLFLLPVLASTPDTSAYAASQVDPTFSAAVPPLIRPSDLPPAKSKNNAPTTPTSPRSLAENLTQDQINVAFDTCFTGAQGLAGFCDLSALAACATPAGPAGGAVVGLACIGKYIYDVSPCRQKYPTAEPNEEEAEIMDEMGLR